MTNRLPDAVAGRWLKVSVDVERVARVRQVGRALRAIAVDFTLGPGGNPPVVKVPCRVVVERRDNGREVAAFDYNNNVEAIAHAANLRERLAIMGLAEFCRDVGIGDDLVADSRPVDTP